MLHNEEQEAIDLTSTLKRAMVAILAVGSLLIPAYALATPAQVGYNTTLQATDPATRVAYFFGTLQLSVSDDGLVHGWYQPQYDGSYTPVTGSYKNGKYWLTLGNGAFQVFATKMRDGSLSGTATNTDITSKNLYPQTFDFYARPTQV